MTEILEENAYDELRVDNITLKKQLDLNLLFVETAINQLAESEDVLALNMKRVDLHSQHLIESMKIVSQIYIMDVQGMQFYKSSYIETMGDRSDRDYFKTAITGKSTFSDVIISRSTNIPITVYASPIYRDGKIDGVIGASIDLSYLSELSATLRSSSDSYGFVVDLKGRIIGHPDPVIVAEMTDINYMSMVSDVLSGKTGVGEYVLDGVEKLVAYTPSEKSGWGVLVQIPKKEAFEMIVLLNKLLFLTAFFILLVSFVVVVIISRRLQMPVEDIIDMIEKIENNQKLNQIPLWKDNEFGKIKKKLLSMDRTIHEYYIELEDRVETRTAELQQALSELESTKTELETANEMLSSMSRTDALTNLPNRRALDEYIERTRSIALRLNLPIAILMADIDYFKKFNDKYGHQEGDKCLVRVSECLLSQIPRQVDFLARYGGEEFIVILMDTDSEGAHKVAQKLCHMVEALSIPNEGSPDNKFITVSIGVSWTSSLENIKIEKLIFEADSNLYKAKNMGRNCVYG
ncbi:MAG: diguanylate cyclase [Spirochaetales bacterium]|nr:diguanylate cyclase [Spirochaetales bacterium]